MQRCFSLTPCPNAAIFIADERNSVVNERAATAVRLVCAEEVHLRSLNAAKPSIIRGSINNKCMDNDKLC